MQVQQQSLEAIAATMLASQGDGLIHKHGVAAMLAIVGCDTRPIGPGVYDVNSTDREGCTVLHRYGNSKISLTLRIEPVARALQPAIAAQYAIAQGYHMTCKSQRSKAADLLCRTPPLHCCFCFILTKQTGLCRLATMGLSLCLSALIQSCGTQLDFRHKCNRGQTPQMAAEANQHQVCADLLSQGASFGMTTAAAARQSSETHAPQAASTIPGAFFPPQPIQHGPQPEDPQQLPSVMPGLFPLLAKMQGQTNAMLHLNMQPAHMYGHNPLLPGLSAPTLSRRGSGFLPPDAASMAASQRASMESAGTAQTRPSLDDASMMSRLYPASSLDSSFSHQAMSYDDPQRRASSSSHRSSVSAGLIACVPCRAPYQVVTEQPHAPLHGTRSGST